MSKTITIQIANNADALNIAIAKGYKATIGGNPNPETVIAYMERTLARNFKDYANQGSAMQAAPPDITVSIT